MKEFDLENLKSAEDHSLELLRKTMVRLGVPQRISMQSALLLPAVKRPVLPPVKRPA